ncbi:MAG TPA: TonB family protein [Bryobacteraceae bacterium]
MLGFVLIGRIACAGGPVAAYRVGDGVSPPKPLHKTEPRYTTEARRAQIQGTVVLQVTVDEKGTPRDISIVSPLGFGLDDRAREAVSRWTFRPGEKDGRAVKTVAIIPVDFRLFHRWFDPSEEQHRTAYNLAVEDIQANRRTDLTIETIKNLATQKYAPAQYLYAKMLDAGDGVPRDPDRALQLLLESCAKNHAAAMYETGRMMLEGRRLPKDVDKGLELVRNAAVLKNRQAQFFLGAAYENGDLFPASPDQARQYYRLCAASGDPHCQVHLARLLLSREGRQERDYLQAIAWLELASASGSLQAKKLLEPERDKLTLKQISWVSKLKDQLVDERR